MIRKIIIIITICIIQVSLEAQDQNLTGIIITEDLELIPGVKIFTSDSIVVGETDMNGCFKIEIPREENELFFGFPGMEWLYIHIHENCQELEIIMMHNVIYDFISLQKVDRLREKRFNKLSEIRSKAFKEGIFKFKHACYEQNFIPYHQ